VTVSGPFRAALRVCTTSGEECVNCPDTSPDQPDVPLAVPWYLRVLPASSVVLAMLVLATAFIPAFRQQAVLSLTRQTSPYVELYFDRPGASSAICAPTGGVVAVRFVVKSHLPAIDSIHYRVRLEPGRHGGDSMRRDGKVVVGPGQAERVSTRLRAPGRHPYTVVVRLRALHQHLVVRCPVATP
jgi:hypothetical protein